MSHSQFANQLTTASIHASAPEQETTHAAKPIRPFAAQPAGGSITASVTTPNASAFERARLSQRKTRKRLLLRQRRKAARTTASCPTSERAPLPLDPTHLNQGPPKSPLLSPSQARGAHYERLARRYLIDAGLRPLAQNLRCRMGEIDLVMLEGSVIVFVEVRARQSARFGGAAASVTVAKRARLMRTAALMLPYLTVRLNCRPASNPPPCRFDVIAIENETIHWFTHAFALD